MSQTNALETIWNKNQKVITYAGIALAAFIALYYFYNTYYLGSKQQEAMSKISQAEMMFKQDSFSLALNNPGGGFPGFIKIANDYGSTTTGNTAKLYAGLSYLNLGQFDEAIKWLEKYKPAGDLAPVLKFGALADAYAEKGDLAKALELYEKAGSSGENEAKQSENLMKAGLLAEKQGNKEKALALYTRIRNDFGTTAAGRDIDKYIVRAGGTLN
jgi:tetratricopeptide (TPR) repeat protein